MNPDWPALCDVLESLDESAPRRLQLVSFTFWHLSLIWKHFYHSLEAQLFQTGQMFYHSFSHLNIYPAAVLRPTFPSLQPCARPTLCGRRRPINYSLMTSVAERLGRKKKLIYLSRGNCLGTVSADESSLRSLFLSDCQRRRSCDDCDHGQGMTDSGHYLPATHLNSTKSCVIQHWQCFWLP